MTYWIFICTFQIKNIWTLYENIQRFFFSIVCKCNDCRRSRFQSRTTMIEKNHFYIVIRWLDFCDTYLNDMCEFDVSWLKRVIRIFFFSKTFVRMKFSTIISNMNFWIQNKTWMWMIFFNWNFIRFIIFFNFSKSNIFEFRKKWILNVFHRK